MRFYTTLKLGPNRELTKEGFTIFRNVCVSRIGEQIYGPDEVEGIEPGEDGLIRIQRTPEEVFRQEAMDSCNGKSLVIDHPMDDVSPENWQHLSHGIMFNARQGIGELSDHVVTDIMVCTKQGVAEIDNGTREVSLGYDAATFRTGIGTGEQRNIFVNHVALVPAGRCGGSCAIKDHKYTEKKECHMKKSIKDRIMDAFKAKDEEGVKKALEDAEREEKEHTKDCDCKDCMRDKKRDEESESKFKKLEDSISKLTDAMKARDEKEEKEKEEQKAKDAAESEEKKKAEDKKRDAEKAEKEEKEKVSDEDLEEEAPDGTGDKARKSRDSAYLVDSFDNVKMLAEVIAPGVKIPTFDQAADPRKTFKDCVCGLRRTALKQGINDAEISAMVDQIRGKVTDSAAIDSMSPSDVRSLFSAVGTMKAERNNAVIARSSGAPALVTDANLSPADRFVAASKARWTRK